MDNVDLGKALTPGIYEHFKGMQYEVVDVALCSETLAPHVVYRALYGERRLWIRPLEMFQSHVEREDYSGPRFVLVD